jgi:hypothetical protein
VLFAKFFPEKAEFFGQNNYHSHPVIEVVKSFCRTHQYRFSPNGLKLFRNFSTGPQSFAAGNDYYTEVLFRNHKFSVDFIQDFL